MHSARLSPIAMSRGKPSPKSTPPLLGISNFLATHSCPSIVRQCLWLKVRNQIARRQIVKHSWRVPLAKLACSPPSFSSRPEKGPTAQFRNGPRLEHGAQGGALDRRGALAPCPAEWGPGCGVRGTPGRYANGAASSSHRVTVGAAAQPLVGWVDEEDGGRDGACWSDRRPWSACRWALSSAERATERESPPGVGGPRGRERGRREDRWPGAAGAGRPERAPTRWRPAVRTRPHGVAQRALGGARPIDVHASTRTTAGKRTGKGRGTGGGGSMPDGSAGGPDLKPSRSERTTQARSNR